MCFGRDTNVATQKIHQKMDPRNHKLASKRCKFDGLEELSSDEYSYFLDFERVPFFYDILVLLVSKGRLPRTCSILFDLVEIGVYCHFITTET